MAGAAKAFCACSAAATFAGRSRALAPAAFHADQLSSCTSTLRTARISALEPGPVPASTLPRRDEKEWHQAGMPTPCSSEPGLAAKNRSTMRSWMQICRCTTGSRFCRSNKAKEVRYLGQKKVAVSSVGAAEPASSSSALLLP